LLKSGTLYFDWNMTPYLTLGLILLAAHADPAYSQCASADYAQFDWPSVS